MSDQPANDFEKLAASQSQGNFLSDFWAFLRNNKKWWLVPVLLVLLILGLLMLFSGSGAAPLIYTFF